ncbi:MAG: ATP-dependent zinc protease family protein [Candidatus Cyclobacteriaceae bacterium M3_2C_046]
MAPSLIIGRADVVDLPDIGLFNIKAKIDTGAYSSAIHCSRIKLIKEDDVPVLTFYVPGSTRMQGKRKLFKVRNYKQKYVKSSSGHIEKRFIIKTKITIFSKSYTTEFSLTDRSAMRFPVLLGRKLLRNRFMVDVSCVNLSQNEKINK